MTWCTSSYSDGAGNCVEVATNDGEVGVRDSKDRPGPVLVFTPDAWLTFTRGIRDNRFHKES